MLVLILICSVSIIYYFGNNSTFKLQIITLTQIVWVDSDTGTVVTTFRVHPPPSSTLILILVLVLVLILIPHVPYNDSNIHSGCLIITIAANSLNFAGDDSFSYNDYVSTSDLNVGGTINATASDTFRVHCFCFNRDESILFRPLLQLLTVLQYTFICSRCLHLGGLYYCFCYFLILIQTFHLMLLLVLLFHDYWFDYSPSIVNPRRLNTYFESISDSNIMIIWQWFCW